MPNADHLSKWANLCAMEALIKMNLSKVKNQIQIEFTTSSPINIGKLSGQNRRLYDYLSEGKHINCMSPEMTLLRIGYLNSRISDLKNKCNVPVQSKFIEVEYLGEKTVVKDYWLEVIDTYLK